MTTTAWMLADALGLQRKTERHVSVYRMFVRDLVVPFRIGIYGHEQKAPQRVRVNAELLVESAPVEDDFGRVVNYETIVDGVRELARAGHINLVETLAERIIDLAMVDPRVVAARVSVEKLDVYPDAESVGVVLKRRRKPPAGG